MIEVVSQFICEGKVKPVGVSQWALFPCTLCSPGFKGYVSDGLHQWIEWNFNRIMHY